MFGILILAPRWISFSLVGSWILLCTANFVLTISSGPKPESVVYNFVFNSLNLEFMGGCLWGFATSHWKFTKGRALLILGSVLLILAGLSSGWLTLIGPLKVLAFGIPSMLLVIGAVASERPHKTEGWIYKKIYLLGDASYSIYLIHYPVLVIGFAFAKKLIFQSSRFTTNSYALIIGTAPVIVGLFVHLFIEAPLLETLRNKFNLAISGGSKRA